MNLPRQLDETSASKSPRSSCPADVAAEAADGLRALLRELTVTEARTARLKVKWRDGVRLIRISEISFLVVEGDNVRIRGPRLDTVASQSLGSVCRHLSPDEFVRIGRSVVVRIDLIRELERVNSRGFNVRLADGTQFRSGRTCYRRILHALRLDALMARDPLRASGTRRAV